LKIERAAKATGLSMNAEIVARIERSFESQGAAGGPREVAVLNFIASGITSFIGPGWAEDREKWNAAFDWIESRREELAPAAPAHWPQIINSIEAAIAEEPPDEYHLIAVEYLVKRLDPKQRDEYMPQIKARQSAIQKAAP
jgi:hypothetical protein